MFKIIITKPNVKTDNKLFYFEENTLKKRLLWLFWFSFLIIIVLIIDFDKMLLRHFTHTRNRSGILQIVTNIKTTFEFFQKGPLKQ